MRLRSVPIVEPDDAVHPTSLDRPLALQLESELDEELSRGREIIDDDAHVVHPFDHGGSSSSRGPSWPLVSLGRSRRHILDTRKGAEF
jgi:hypothetical protein